MVSASTFDLIALYVGVTPKRITERCEVLARVDLIVPSCDHRNPEEATMWELGYWGERYLAGDVNTELIWPAPSPRPPEAVRPAWWAGLG